MGSDINNNDNDDINDNNEKFCQGCKTWVDAERFHLDGGGRRRRLCAPCTNERRRMRRKEKQGRKGLLIHAMLELSRHDLDRLIEITEDEFVNKTNSHEALGEFGFDDIKDLAEYELLKSGHHRPEQKTLPAGRYMVVGDSHGKHTKTKMFDLIKNVNQYLAIDNIIHVGHILDDDNDISYNWSRYFDNLIVLPKIEEAKNIERICENKGYDFEIVRDEVQIGDMTVLNQDLITDYVKTYIRSLDPEIFPDTIITNNHKHELSTRTTHNGNVFVASPGALCERHIVKTIKQIDFTNGYQIKQARTDGFIKYRRMRHMFEFWQQGAIIVELDEEGNSTMTHIKIKKIGKDYVTSYFDDIITSSGVEKPDKKIILNGDNHIPVHDGCVMDIQEQVCMDYKPDVVINVGDFANGSGLNHHAMDRGHPIVDENVLRESAEAHYILKRMATWADELHIMHGNHERFNNDFIEKYPQLEGLLNFDFLANIHDLNYHYYTLKDVIRIGDLSVIHGDFVMYGQGGSKHEKASRTFPGTVVMGHVHYPAIRFNCYSMGLSGQLDQHYNEAKASNWVHGFGMCNQYKGHSFVNTIAIQDYRLVMNGTTYSPNDPSSWSLPTFKAKIVYDFD